jgi:hypothetical protein
MQIHGYTGQRTVYDVPFCLHGIKQIYSRFHWINDDPSNNKALTPIYKHIREQTHVVKDKITVDTFQATYAMITR